MSKDNPLEAIRKAEEAFKAQQDKAREAMEETIKGAKDKLRERKKELLAEIKEIDEILGVTSKPHIMGGGSKRGKVSNDDILTYIGGEKKTQDDIATKFAVGKQTVAKGLKELVKAKKLVESDTRPKVYSKP